MSDEVVFENISKHIEVEESPTIRWVTRNVVVGEIWGPAGRYQQVEQRQFLQQLVRVYGNKSVSKWVDVPMENEQ